MINRTKSLLAQPTKTLVCELPPTSPSQRTLVQNKPPGATLSPAWPWPWPEVAPDDQVCQPPHYYDQQNQESTSPTQRTLVHGLSPGATLSPAWPWPWPQVAPGDQVCQPPHYYDQQNQESTSPTQRTPVHNLPPGATLSPVWPWPWPPGCPWRPGRSTGACCCWATSSASFGIRPQNFRSNCFFACLRSLSRLVFICSSLLVISPLFR